MEVRLDRPEEGPLRLGLPRAISGRFGRTPLLDSARVGQRRRRRRRRRHRWQRRRTIRLLDTLPEPGPRMMPDHLKAFACTGLAVRLARPPASTTRRTACGPRCAAGLRPTGSPQPFREWDRGQDGIEVVPTGQMNPKFLRRSPLIERDFVTEISTSHVSKSEVSKQPTHSQGLVNTFRPLDAEGLVRRLRDREP